MTTTPARRNRKPRNAGAPARPITLVPPPPDEPAPASVEGPVQDLVALFRKGRNISQIARSAKVAQQTVREALDAAGVDYSADKNAKPVAAATTRASTPRGEPKAWTLLASYESILAKKIDPKSKRGQVVADLASDANASDLQTITLKLNEVTDRHAMAAMMNALNAALSAHYARV